MAAELQMADFLQHVSLLMESNFVHVMTVLLASVYCNMLLIDVFGQTFVMYFHSDRRLASLSKTTSTC